MPEKQAVQEISAVQECTETDLNKRYSLHTHGHPATEAVFLPETSLIPDHISGLLFSSDEIPDHVLTEDSLQREDRKKSK